jgi:pimeloyl-ACP methyl ester carboxylesterase
MMNRAQEGHVVLKRRLNVAAHLLGALASVLMMMSQEGKMFASITEGKSTGAAVVGALVPRFVSIATGVQLEYVEQGAPGGLPVIFLHGVTDSWRSFELMLPHLPPSMRAFAISQRGHGDSSRPAAGYTYTDLSEDVRAFMDAMGLGRAVIVGHSMGSSIAQRLIADHPERVTAVVLMGAFASIGGSAAVREFVTTSVLPLSDPIHPDFAREWQLSTIARPIDPGFLDTVVQETLKVPARVWHEAFGGFLTTPDFTDELSRAAIPVLLMWGERDAFAPRGDPDVLLKALPTARLVIHEGAGHALHWEAPGRVATELVDFIDSLGSSR